MLDFVLQFYENYTLLFYFFLVILVTLEGPITILSLSLIAPSFGIGFIGVYFFAILGEFFGDLLHYFIGRFLKKKFFKERKFELFEKTEEKLKHHSLLDKLIVIKYTPPITSIGLLYLGFRKTNIKKFIKDVFIFSVFNGFLVTFIGFHFGTLFVNKNDFEYILAGIFFSFLLLYFLVRFIGKLLIDSVLKK